MSGSKIKGNSYKGGSVWLRKDINRWVASCQSKYLGCFETQRDAYIALFLNDPVYWTEEKKINKLKYLP
jgi:hypothetical protein